MFKPGNANSPSTVKPSKADAERRDEYEGRYKDAADGMSEAQKFGTDQMPVQHDPLPATKLRTAGG
jgi:hypothetical protein